jgi:putative spermidine/putrescine transport system permease protein
MNRSPLRHLLLVPGVLSIAVLFASYLNFFRASFLQMSDGGLSVGGTPNIDSYVRILGSWSEFFIIAETLWVSLWLTIASLILALPLALIIARSTSTTVRRIVLLTTAVTFLSGGVTRAYSWIIILGNNGLFNALLKKLGLIDVSIRMIYNWTGVSIALVHFLLPFTIFTLVGAIRNLPASVEDAARNLGASRTQAFMFVTMPLLLPGIIVTACLTYSIALSSFLFPLLLGGGRARMAANYIYERLFVLYDIPFAAATSVIFLIASFAAIACIGRIERAVRWAVRA